MAKKCVKGLPCGASCIAAYKTCQMILDTKGSNLPSRDKICSMLGMRCNIA